MVWRCASELDVGRVVGGDFNGNLHILCRLIEVFSPGSIRKISRTDSPMAHLVRFAA